MSKTSFLSQSDYQISDNQWNEWKKLLPPPKQKKKAGRPRMDDRQAMAAILYQQRTGCPWKLLPPHFGAPSTIHDRWLEWQHAGVFEHLPQIRSEERYQTTFPPPPFQG